MAESETLADIGCAMSTETRLRQAFHAECRYGEGSRQMATLGVDPATTWALPVGRPTLPWDYFPLARHPGAIRTLCSRKEENTLPRDDFCAENKGGTLVTPLKGLRREHGVLGLPTCHLPLLAERLDRVAPELRRVQVF